jgi:hypothetical protein
MTTPEIPTSPHRAMNPILQELRSINSMLEFLLQHREEFSSEKRELLERAALKVDAVMHGLDQLRSGTPAPDELESLLSSIEDLHASLAPIDADLEASQLVRL